MNSASQDAAARKIKPEGTSFPPSTSPTSTMNVSGRKIKTEGLSTNVTSRIIKTEDLLKNLAPRKTKTEGPSFPPSPTSLQESTSTSTALLSGELGPLNEHVRAERHKMYAPVRANLHIAAKTKKFMRLPMILKFFMKMIYKPEPDTLELLADVLEIEDIEKNGSVCKELRSVADKLRVKDGELANPVGYLESCVGSLKDDFHLITSKEVSQPTYTSSKNVSGEGMQDVLVDEVRIRLARCSYVKMYVMEVVERAREPCEENEIDTEIARRKSRLRRAAALKALKALRLLIKEAQNSN